MRELGKNTSLKRTAKAVLVALALCLTCGFTCVPAFADSTSNATSLPSPTVLDTIVPSKTTIPDVLAYGKSNEIDLDKVELLEGGSFWQLKSYDNPLLALTTKSAQKGDHTYNPPTAKIKIPNYLTDTNGKDLDLILTLDFDAFNTYYVNDNADYEYYPTAFGILATALECYAQPTASDATSYASVGGNICCQNIMNVDVQLVYAGTNTQYTSQYPAAWSYSDLDIASCLADSNHKVSFIDRSDPSDTGSFNESVYLDSGFQKTYVSKQYNLSNDSTNRWFISKPSENGGNVAGSASCEVAGLVALSDAGHFKFIWRGSGAGTSVLKSANYLTGIKLTKTSSDAAYTQSCVGGVYGVYSDATCKTLVKKITLDSNGQGTSGDVFDLEKTTYYVKEITPPQGYKADATVYTCDLSSYAGKWYELDLTDEPLTYQVTTEVENGSIDAGETLYWGSNKTINYSADEGYHIAKVVVDGNEVDPSAYPDSYTFENIKSEHSISVTFEIDTFSVATSVEHGTIDVSDTSCVNDDGTYNWHTSPAISYKADEGYHLAKVLVDGNEVSIEDYADSYTFESIEANHNIKALYEINTYLIDTAIENGSIDEGAKVNWGESKTITYKADEGYHIARVIVDGQDIDINEHPESYTFENVQAEHSIKVITAIDTYSVATSVENGSIDTVDKSCVNEDGNYDYHASPTITYKANEGYHLGKVIVDGEKVNKAEFPKSYTFANIEGAHELNVVFEINTYAINTSVEHGTIDEECTVNWDGSKTVSYAPDEGYHLAKVIVDGKEVSKKDFADSYTFDGVRENHSIDVVYEINTYEIDTAIENGSIDEGAKVNWGESKTITYKADEGYHLAKIEVDGKEVAIDKYAESYTFENIDAAHSIKVTCEINTYAIETSAEHGSIDKSDESCVNEDGSYNWHTSPTITYKADEGYELNKVIVDGQEVDKDKFADSYKFENLEGNHKIEVVYNKIDTAAAQSNNVISETILTGDNLILFGIVAGVIALAAGVVGFLAWKKKSA